MMREDALRELAKLTFGLGPADVPKLLERVANHEEPELLRLALAELGAADLLKARP